MANFSLFIPKLLKHEGGYSNLKADRGGETYRGITRKNFPKWLGWAIIDKQPKPIKYNVVFTNLEPLVKAFYKANFWVKMQADNINSQPIAETVVDHFVNTGRNIVSDKFIIDNALKKGKTLADTLNAGSEPKILTSITDARVRYYNAISKGNQTQFQKGWLIRAKSFMTNLPIDKTSAGAGVAALVIGLFFLIKSNKRKS